MNKVFADNYWMGLVEKVSYASTCRKCLGCVLVQNNYCIGMGYVGSVHGDIHCNDNNACLLVDNKGAYGSGDATSCIRTIHAEMNAILNMQQMIRGSKGHWIECYSTYQPCLNCFKALLQIGVRKFVYQYPYLDINRDIYVEHCIKLTVFSIEMYIIE